MSHTRAWTLLSLALLCLMKSNAETIQIGRLPSKPGVAGFVMDVKMEAVASNGYQPIHLEFTPLGKAFTHDRHVQVFIRPKYSYNTDLDYDFQCSVVLPEGAGKIDFPYYLPHYYPWNSFQVRLFENNRAVETGSTVFSLTRGLRSRFAEQEVTVGIIQARDASVQDAPWKVYPDVRTLVTVLGDGPLPEDVKSKRLSHAAAKNLAARVQPCFVQFRPLEEEKLPVLWLGYTQLDVIIVTAPVLQRIETQQPERFAELKDWLAAGGNLWVHATGSSRLSESASPFLGHLQVGPPDLQKILAPNKVNAALDLSNLNDTTDLVHDGWNGVRKSSAEYGFDRQTALVQRATIHKKMLSNQHPFADTVDKKKLASQVQIGTYGLGTVVSIPAEDPFPGSFQFWRSVANLLGSDRLQWTQRMGIDVPQGNDNYWMWLIPSVGQPPVKSFVLLNTLFAIFVGPLCYFFFRKRERLYMLYFVAPVLALVVTVSLFAYAVTADGMQTKVRTRQVTWVDSKHRCAVMQSRQTYYAVLGVSGGISMPTETAVFPVKNSPTYQNYYRRRRPTRSRTYTVTGDAQVLANGFLPPRDQVQYLTSRPVPGQVSLDFQWTVGGGEVSSQLPYTIRRLVARDAEGTYWQADQIEPGATVKLRVASSQILAEWLDASVIPPLESVPMLQSNRGQYGGKTTGMQVSMLENRLNQWGQALPMGVFVALADTVPEELGVDDAVVLESVHVLMGEIP